ARSSPLRSSARTSRGRLHFGPSVAPLRRGRLRAAASRAPNARVLTREEDRLVAVLPADPKPLVPLVAEHFDDHRRLRRLTDRPSFDDDLVAGPRGLAMTRLCHRTSLRSVFRSVPGFGPPRILG